jgi:hypothetical protein
MEDLCGVIELDGVGDLKGRMIHYEAFFPAWIPKSFCLTIDEDGELSISELVYFDGNA